MQKKSIFIPAYIANKYIRCCLDSVKALSLTDFEILVDNLTPSDFAEKIELLLKNDILKQNIIEALKKENIDDHSGFDMLYSFINS